MKADDFVRIMQMLEKIDISMGYMGAIFKEIHIDYRKKLDELERRLSNLEK